MRPRRSPTWFRIVADILMVNGALLLALSLRFLWAVGVDGIETTDEGVPLTFGYYLSAYLHNFWIVTALVLAVFHVSEIYGRRRSYPLRAKLWTLVQCVSLAYAIFGMVSFVLVGLVTTSRAAFFLAWALTVALVVGTRIWSAFWKQLVSEEMRLAPPSSAHEPVRSVLVIGGAGYVGSRLLPRLLEAGYRVRLMDLMLFGFESIHDIADHPRLEIKTADFRAVDQVVEAMQDMDAVIHLGGIVGDPACAIDEALTVEVNLVATRMVAEVAKSMRIQRFVFASTCSVYGASDETLDEGSQLNPVSVYAKSKIASERGLHNLTDDLFRPTVLRFGTLYGLSGRMRFDLVVNLLTAKSLMDGEITIMSGDQWRPFLHVDDAARALLAALQSPIDVVGGETFNVGGDEQNMTIQDAGDTIHAAVPDAKMIQAGEDTDRRNYRVSFAKIVAAMNFRLKWTVESGVAQMAEFVKAGNVKNWRDRRYSNVKSLSDESVSQLVRIDTLLDETK